MSLMHHHFNEQEKLALINDNQEDFVKGIFSTPEEMSTWARREVTMDREEASYKSAAFILGHELGIELAIKNYQAKVKKAGVEDV